MKMQVQAHPPFEEECVERNDDDHCEDAGQGGGAQEIEKQSRVAQHLTEDTRTRRCGGREEAGGRKEEGRREQRQSVSGDKRGDKQRKIEWERQPGRVTNMDCTKGQKGGGGMV